MRVKGHLYQPRKSWQVRFDFENLKTPPLANIPTRKFEKSCRQKISCHDVGRPLGYLALREKIMAYAIIQTGGRQFRVQPGDVVQVELLGVEAGQ